MINLNFFHPISLHLDQNQRFEDLADSFPRLDHGNGLEFRNDIICARLNTIGDSFD
jgi:hypothetical protein